MPIQIPHPNRTRPVPRRLAFVVPPSSHPSAHIPRLIIARPRLRRRALAMSNLREIKIAAHGDTSAAGSGLESEIGRGRRRSTAGQAAAGGVPEPGARGEASGDQDAHGVQQQVDVEHLDDDQGGEER